MKRHFQNLRDSVKDQDCCNCGNIGTTVLAHLGAPYSSGVGLKSPDYQAAGLCFECHKLADTDPAYISDFAWRYRMVANQWAVWIRNGVITIA